MMINSGETQTFEMDRLAELRGEAPATAGAAAAAVEREEVQLSFEETELTFTENEDNPSIPLTAREPVSLPAALVDEKLLEEIQSIPDKMGFKIGDVADILGIKQYVLRYWETEFDVLKPKKAANNQRMYTRKDVENALLIRKLLHRDRFSIEGARNAMKELKSAVKKEKEMNQVMHKIGNMNESIEDLVSDIRRVRLMFQ